MKAFLDRTFVNGNGNDGFLGEHGSGTVKFKTTEGVERQARMMFLTGRKVDEPEAKEPARGRAEEREGAAPTGQEGEGAPAAAAVQRPGQAGGGGARSPANATSSPGRSSTASGTGSSAAGW